MIAVFLAPIYLALNVYIAYRISLWLKTIHKLFAHPALVTFIYILYAMLTLSPLAATFASGSLQRYGRFIFNHWLGALLYLIVILIVVDIGKLIYRLIKKQPILPAVSEKVRRIRGVIIFVLVISISVYGKYHSYDTKKTSYDVTVNKAYKDETLKIALVADLHLGANVGVKHMTKMRDIINEMEPDLVVYAGDIFDNSFDAIDDPDEVQAILKSISATYGSYACWGNHDIDEIILAGFTFQAKDQDAASDPRMDEFLEQSGITLLKDETVLIDDSFYLAGRIDKSAKWKSNIVRKTPSELLFLLDSDKPIFVIDHQPAELFELSEAGSDITLSGHTHNGQNFPGNLTIKLMWENACGMIKVGNMTDIVTSGVGVWGPAIRVGTDSEVVEVNVHFEK